METGGIDSLDQGIILSDYEHMGAVVVGENISTIIAGRRTPRMQISVIGNSVTSVADG
jgi:hypothetical protein